MATWTIIIGLIAGVIAKFIHPGSNEPQGFILTTVLGIIGAFVATYPRQAIGGYKAGEGAGLIGAIIGAVILLVIWGFFPRKKRCVNWQLHTADAIAVRLGGGLMSA